MRIYFISYFWTAGMSSGHGNTDVAFPRPIRTMADIREVERGVLSALRAENPFVTAVTIQTFQKFED